eukprot:4980701-Prymnesium_polylepis.1
MLALLRESRRLHPLDALRRRERLIVPHVLLRHKLGMVAPLQVGVQPRLVAQQRVALLGQPKLGDRAAAVRVVLARELAVGLRHILAGRILVEAQPLEGWQRLQAHLMQHHAARGHPAERPAVVLRRVADAGQPAAQVREASARTTCGRRRHVAAQLARVPGTRAQGGDHAAQRRRDLAQDGHGELLAVLRLGNRRAGGSAGVALAERRVERRADGAHVCARKRAERAARHVRLLAAQLVHNLRYDLVLPRLQRLERRLACHRARAALEQRVLKALRSMLHHFELLLALVDLVERHDNVGRGRLSLRCENLVDPRRERIGNVDGRSTFARSCARRLRLVEDLRLEDALLDNVGELLLQLAELRQLVERRLASRRRLALLYLLDLRVETARQPMQLERFLQRVPLRFDFVELLYGIVHLGLERGLERLGVLQRRAGYDRLEALGEGGLRVHQRLLGSLHALRHEHPNGHGGGSHDVSRVHDISRNGTVRVRNAVGPLNERRAECPEYGLNGLNGFACIVEIRWIGRRHGLVPRQ